VPPALAERLHADGAAGDVPGGAADGAKRSVNALRRQPPVALATVTRTRRLAAQMQVVAGRARDNIVSLYAPIKGGLGSEVGFLYAQYCLSGVGQILGRNEHPVLCHAAQHLPYVGDATPPGWSKRRRKKRQSRTAGK
jgi:hypothetical protein